MTGWAALLGCHAPDAPRVGHPACAEVAGLEPGDEYLEGGHLVRVTASGADDRGAATLEALAAADHPWSTEPPIGPPTGDDWVLVGGTDEWAGHRRLSDTPPGRQLAFRGRIYRTVEADGEVEVRRTGRVLGPASADGVDLPVGAEIYPASSPAWVVGAAWGEVPVDLGVPELRVVHGGAAWVREAPPKVIGRRADTASARWDGYDVLDTVDWSLALNDAWIREGIDNGQDFTLASPIDGNRVSAGRPTVFDRELRQLEAAGYERRGHVMEAP